VLDDLPGRFAMSGVGDRLGISSGSTSSA